MIVVFDGAVSVYHPASGLTLTPGDNTVSDAQGEALLAAGVVRKPSPSGRRIAAPAAADKDKE